jgi:hypothetical protein
MWLLERLVPDFKTIADFREDNGKGIKNTCRAFIDICPASKALTYRFSGVENGLTIKKYFLDIMTCRACALKSQCSNSKQQRRISRWEHQDEIDHLDDLMASMPDSMLIRKQTAGHPFGTIKFWMGATHFLTRGFKKVSTKMSLHVLAYNLKRMMSILGPEKLIAAMAA